MHLKYNTVITIDKLELEFLVVSAHTVINILGCTVEIVLVRRINIIAILKLDVYSRFIVDLVQFQLGLYNVKLYYYLTEAV
jgi:hypothetical protein